MAPDPEHRYNSRMSVTDRLIAQISPNVRKRGVGYFNARRVTVYSAGPTEVTAAVRGSRL